jgi:hypothetical protein
MIRSIGHFAQNGSGFTAAAIPQARCAAPVVARDLNVPADPALFPPLDQDFASSPTT